MKRISYPILMCMVFCCLRSYAEDRLPDFGRGEGNPDGRFLVLKNPNFSHYMRAVRYYLAYHHRSYAINHLCVVGYHLPSTQRSPAEGFVAYVHWKEGNRLIFWSGTSSATTDDSLTLPPNDLGWKDGTVMTDAEVHGNYLITRAFWRSIVADCDKNGEVITVNPSQGHIASKNR